MRRKHLFSIPRRFSPRRLTPRRVVRGVIVRRRRAARVVSRWHSGRTARRHAGRLGAGLDSPVGSRRMKRGLVGILAAGAILVDAGAAAAQATVADEQVAITTPPAGSADWVRDSSLGQVLPDPATADAAAVAAFFSGLTETQQDNLIARYPLVVGNIDGAPLALRYRANALALAQARDVARARAIDPKLSLGSRTLAATRVKDCERLMSPGRQILAFDPRGRGLVSEVFGDLAAAQRISVIIPGSDTDLSHFERTEQPLRAPVGMAQALLAEEHAQSGSTRTAVIAWTGYVTPMGIGADALTSRLAVAAAPRLVSLLAGLAVTTDPATSPTLLCHSYGTVVCGTAAPKIRTHDGSGQPTDIVVFGSPGMDVDNAAELGTGVRLWATRNATDWIGNVPYLEVGGLGHGQDPTGLGFGAEDFSSAGAAGHAGYFVAGTASLHNFGAIALGRYDQVSRIAPGSGA